MVLSCHRPLRDHAVSLARRLLFLPRSLTKLGLALSALWGGAVTDSAAHTHGAQAGYMLSRTGALEPPSTGYTLEQAVAKVRAEVPGRILSAETVVHEGRVVYRIKVLTDDGRVTVIEIDAHTGKPPQ